MCLLLFRSKSLQKFILFLPVSQDLHNFRRIQCFIHWTFFCRDLWGLSIWPSEQTTKLFHLTLVSKLVNRRFLAKPFFLLPLPPFVSKAHCGMAFVDLRIIQAYKFDLFSTTCVSWLVETLSFFLEFCHKAVNFEEFNWIFEQKN